MSLKTTLLGADLVSHDERKVECQSIECLPEWIHLNAMGKLTLSKVSNFKRSTKPPLSDYLDMEMNTLRRFEHLKFWTPQPENLNLDANSKHRHLNHGTSMESPKLVHHFHSIIFSSDRGSFYSIFFDSVPRSIGSQTGSLTMERMPLLT
jgi:hypothetical protein